MTLAGTTWASFSGTYNNGATLVEAPAPGAAFRACREHASGGSLCAPATPSVGVHVLRVLRSNRGRAIEGGVIVHAPSPLHFFAFAASFSAMAAAAAARM